MTDDDRHLDDLLRQLPLPDGLRSRGGLEQLFDDDAVDRLVARIAVPAGLADRVRASLATGGGRVAGVVDLARFSAGTAGEEPVAVPPDVWRRVRRLRTAAREAAAVAMALGLALLLAVVGIEVSRRLEGSPQPRDIASVPPGAARPDWPVPKAGSRAQSVRASESPAAATPPAVAAAESTRPDSPRFADTGETGPASDPGEAAEVSAGGGRESVAAAASKPEVVRGAAVAAAEWRLPPTMTTVPLPAATRRTVPRSPAFDFAFEMAHGESPFVDPAADPALAIDRPPLTLATDSFDALLAHGLGRRGRSQNQPVRVEEVLAAMPPPPALLTEAAGPVQLGLHAVSSGRLVGGRPSLLLEAAVHAPGRWEPTAEPLRATLILDQSMAGDPFVWPRVCRGLAAVASQLEPAARLSVVLCGGRPRVALRDADPTELVAAAENWERIPPAATADLDAGLELARAEGLASNRTILVSHAVTLDRSRSAVAEALAEWHRAAALAGGDRIACLPRGNGPRFLVIDPAAADANATEPTFGRTGSDAVAIRRELLRQVTGRPSLVASQCRLEVRFDPARVERYRIVGHRQSSVASLSADPVPGTDLHAGETTRVVYEVVPRRAGEAGLADAVLSWRSPDGELGRIAAADTGRDDRRGGTLSAHGRSLVLAAWVGELAGGSAHQTDRRSLIARLDALARDWRSGGDISPFAATLTGLLDRRSGEQRPPR